MPNLDKTGPKSQGAGTGRGMGSCDVGYGIGRGFGMGRRGKCYSGYGQGRRRFISPENELSALENEEKILLEDLELIKSEKKALKNEK
jgi:hypothetical protein